MMNKFTTKIHELEDRLFYMIPFTYYLGPRNAMDYIKERNLTILMTPFSDFKSENVNLPSNEYYKSIVDFLRNGNEPAIILSDYHLDRLMIETMKGKINEMRIFMQSSTEEYSGFGYYKDENKLLNLVNKINPTRIKIGGAFLEEDEKELIKWDLEKYLWETSADSGCFVDALYLLFRDKYPIEIAKDLVLK